MTLQSQQKWKARKVVLIFVCVYLYMYVCVYVCMFVYVCMCDHEI